MFAVITGASSGIGFEISKLLAKRGYDLIIVARRKDRLDKMRKIFEERYSIQVVPIEVDLSKEDNCIKLFENIKHYPIEVWVNSAGFGKLGRFEDISLQEEIDMINTNIIK